MDFRCDMIPIGVIAHSMFSRKTRAYRPNINHWKSDMPYESTGAARAHYLPAEPTATVPPLSVVGSSNTPMLSSSPLPLLQTIYTNLTRAADLLKSDPSLAPTFWDYNSVITGDVCQAAVHFLAKYAAAVKDAGGQRCRDKRASGGNNTEQYRGSFNWTKWN